MKRKTIMIVALLVCAVGAWYHFTGGPPPLVSLMQTPATVSAETGPDIRTIEPGQDLAQWCEPGRITIFAFMSDSCSACRMTKSRLRELAGRRPDVAVRLIDLGRRWHRVNCMERYGINLRSIPHVMIYDADGESMAADYGRNKAGFELLCKWMAAERHRED